MSNQEKRQQSVRAVTGTTYAYNDDWMALFTAAGITTGTYNERLKAWINAQLSTAYTTIPDAMRAYAINQSVTSWGELGTFTPGVLPAEQWDSARCSSNLTLSNNNLDAASTLSSWDSVIAKQGKSTGAYYFEIEIVIADVASNIIYGLADGTSASAALTTFVGSFADSIGFRGVDSFKSGAGITILGNGTIAPQGSKVMIAVDFTSGSIWTGIDGTWTGATPSTVATTGRQASFTGGPTLYPAVGLIGNGNKARLSVATARQTYSPPSGFSAWV